MGLATFKGGCHPYEGKELSENKQVDPLMPKVNGTLVFPMSQHIGAPANPVVQKGDKVLRGQVIGQAAGFMSTNIVSSVSGTVKAVEPRRTSGGGMVNSVVIENDGEDTPVEGLGTEHDPASLSNEEILSMIQDAGIVGLGGAGFPTHVKLAPKDPDSIDTIIVNGAECEPYLTSDYRLMIEQPEKLVGGLKIILQLFDKARGVIAIENNKPEAVKTLQELVKDEPRIEVCEMKTKYPQGGERNIIYAVTKRKINSSMLPADAGCIVDNVDTVISIYNAVALGIPLMRRIFTITGDAVKDPRNYEVRLGMSFADVVEGNGGFETQPEKIIAGGPMMGMALFDLDIPITKTNSALLCFVKDQVAENPETACIRCGKCVSVCPSHIVPVKMMAACKRGDAEEFEKLNGMECMECGSCTFVCPAKRPLTQAFKEMRKVVSANRRKKG